MENIPVVTNASFNCRAFCSPKRFLKKQKRIKRHFERMIKVRSGCMRRQSDAKELTAKCSECFFVNIVFK